MAGLLDVFNSYDGQQALGLLAAAGGRSDGAGFGQRLMEGLSQGDKWKAAQAQEEMRKQQILAQQQQMQMHAMQMEQSKRQMAKEAAIEALLPQFQKQGMAGLSPLAGNAELGIQPSAGRQAVAPTFDYKGFAGALASIDPMKALTLQASLQKEGQINKLDVKDFTPASVAKFAQTNNYADLVRMDKAHFANIGGQTIAADPFTGKALNAIDNTQSPDSKASNAVSWANYGLSKDRLSMDRANQEKPQWIESLGGFVDPKLRTVRPAMDMQGNPIASAGPKMTEDQAKASGWLVQAENAYKNMTGAMTNDKGVKTGAEKPGFGDAVAQVPMLGAVGNWLQSSDRQKFNQGASSMSEAFLRAATGAGMNREEAIQKVKEITPQFGDSAEVRKQKLDSIPLYIEALKMRSGSGAQKAASIMSNSGNTGGWSIQRVD